MLSNINKMVYFYTAYTVRVTIFSSGGKFHLVHSYTLLSSHSFICALGVKLILIFSDFPGNTQFTQPKLTWI